MVPAGGWPPASTTTAVGGLGGVREGLGVAVGVGVGDGVGRSRRRLRIGVGERHPILEADGEAGLAGAAVALARVAGPGVGVRSVRRVVPRAGARGAGRRLPEGNPLEACDARGDGCGIELEGERLEPVGDRGLDGRLLRSCSLPPSFWQVSRRKPSGRDRGASRRPSHRRRCLASPRSPCRPGSRCWCPGSRLDADVGSLAAAESRALRREAQPLTDAVAAVTSQVYRPQVGLADRHRRRRASDGSSTVCVVAFAGAGEAESEDDCDEGRPQPRRGHVGDPAKLGCAMRAAVHPRWSRAETTPASNRTPVALRVAFALRRALEHRHDNPENARYADAARLAGPAPAGARADDFLVNQHSPTRAPAVEATDDGTCDSDREQRSSAPCGQ